MYRKIIKIFTKKDLFYHRNAFTAWTKKKLQDHPNSVKLNRMGPIFRVLYNFFANSTF